MPGPPFSEYGDEPETEFEKEALARINQLRWPHLGDPLIWSKELTEMAKTRAKFMAFTGAVTVIKEEDYGENFFAERFLSGPCVSATAIVDKWYSEIRFYRFGRQSPRNPWMVRSFSQLIWNVTTHVGMAYFVFEDYVYAVAKFWPKGNIIAEYESRVPRIFEPRLPI